MEGKGGFLEKPESSIQQMRVLRKLVDHFLVWSTAHFAGSPRIVNRLEGAFQ
jgi:hypothetical protein